MNDTLTVVLPMHNAERQLQRSVVGILELAQSLSLEVRLAIVDDGSTDDTFDLACELATKFPQVSVLRQPFQRGLGPALDRVRRAFGVREVIVHDGMSHIDLDELADCLQAGHADSATDNANASPPGGRFASVAALDARLRKVHREINAFRWVGTEPRILSRRQSQQVLLSGMGVSAGAASGASSPTPSSSSLTVG